MKINMNKYCGDCKYDVLTANHEPCKDCYYKLDHPYFEPKEKEPAPIDQAKERLFKSLDDIQKIIDDAMEKGDRSVHISVVGDKVDVSVQPYKEDEWGEWIEVKSDRDDLPLTFTVGYRCSKCGHHHPHMSLYCSICGSRMKAPKPIEEGEKDAK